MSSRIPWLSALIPSDAVFWYSLDTFNYLDGAIANIVESETGEAWELHPPTDDAPLWRTLSTGERYIEFDGTNDPLQTNDIDSINVKHFFAIASFDGASFDDNNGLLTQLVATTPILIGQTGTTKFFDFSLPLLQYAKSGLTYLASNMQAPMGDVPELVELYYPTGFDLTDLQIGKDRDQTGRLWKGQFHFAAGFPRQLSNTEVARMRLYANLRSHLWEALEETLQFPTPEIIFDNASTYSVFMRLAKKFEGITHSHTYTDERKTFNRVVPLPPQRWRVEFNGITAAKADVLDAFSENVGIDQPFNFYDYRRGVNYSGVRVEDYERSHDGHKSYQVNCRFDLVKY